MSAESTPSVAPAPPSSSAADTAVAIRNGLRLGASLIATWTVAMVVRLQVPRQLGPELFGRFNFADAFTGGIFALLSLGVATYIMREVAVRPQHASDFFGGLVLVRSVLGALALLGIAYFVTASDRPSELTPLVLTFSLVHFVIGINGYLASILQASTQVSALANVNVVSKLIWGGGLMLALALGAPLWALAVPSLLSELLKLVVLLRAARAAIGLELRVDLGATKQVVLASMPFYANAIAVELGARIDVSMLEFMSVGPEVGWYSAANNFAALAMLVSPVIGWVVMPLLSRARARSEEEFFTILRQSIRAVLLLAIPGALMIALGADFWVELAFGRSFAPAADAVRVLAPMFVASYLAILLSVTLVVMQRSWTLSTVSFVSLGLEAVFILGAVYLLGHSGPGGAATGAAVGFAAAEVCTVLLLLVAVGRRALDRTSVLSLGKCALVGVATLLVHRALVAWGPWRLAVDLVIYVAGVLATGAVRVREVRALVEMLRARRSGASG